MKKIWLASISIVTMVAWTLTLPVQSEEKAQTKSAAQLEKEKAQQNPYPNDLGPDKIDVSKYNSALKEGYKIMQDRCSRCHTPSRPLNSQFLQLKAEEQAKIKKTNPEIFKDKHVWQVEERIWERYVKRMMAKPGCDITKVQGKKIFNFIVEYSKRTKTGANAKVWAKQRRKLMADFKENHPKRYKELFETE